MASSESDNGSQSRNPPPVSETMSYKSMPRVGLRPMTAYRTMLPTPPPSLGSHSKATQETHTTNSPPTDSIRRSLAQREQNPQMRLLKRQIEHLQRERNEQEGNQERTPEEDGRNREDESGQKNTEISKSSTMKHEMMHAEIEQNPYLDEDSSIFENEARDKRTADLQSGKKVMFEAQMKDKQPKGQAGFGGSQASRDSGYVSSATSNVVNRLKARNHSLHGTPEEEISNYGVPLTSKRMSGASPSSNPKLWSTERPIQQEWPRNESNRPEYNPIVPPTPTIVDAVYAAVGTKDHTVHLELDLFEDFDEELEEFNRLVRVGSFANAKLFFDLHLKAHVSNPYVFVQYAEMLLEKGDFKSLSAIDGSPVFDGRDSPEDLHTTFEFKQRLELNWKLIQALALCFSQHELHTVWKGLHNLPAQSPRDAIYHGSTELKIMLLTMRLTRLVATPSILGDIGERQLSDWVDWKRLYQQLLSEDRVWDFRDAFLAVSACYGTENALSSFLDYGSSIQDLLADWQTDPPDESTNLALLDILSLTALATGTYTGVYYLAETCVQLAESIGNLLLNSSPDLVLSRPFLRWVVAKAAVNSGPRYFKYFSDYPGLTIFPRIEGMPYYIPVSQENPGWLPLEPTPTSCESLQMALISSRIMQDYKTEALCLRELALRTLDPKELIHELGQLQRFKQHNMDGYLVTLLSRYLICRDYSSKENLRKEIENFGIQTDSSDLVNPTGVAARAVLQHALSQDPADNAGLSLGSALKYYQHLPKAFQRVIDCHYPAPPSTVRGGGDGSPLIIAGKRSPWEKPSEKETTAPTITKAKRVVHIIQPEDAAITIDIKGQHAQDSLPSSSQDVDQAGESKPQQRSKAEDSQSHSGKKSPDISRREDRPPEVAKDRGRPERQQQWHSSSESTYTTSSSESESYDGETDSDDNGKEFRNSAGAEHARDSPGRPSGTHSRSRSQTRDDKRPQPDTETHFVGMSTTPTSSAPVKGPVGEEKIQSEEGSLKTSVRAGELGNRLDADASQELKKERTEPGKQPQAD